MSDGEDKQDPRKLLQKIVNFPGTNRDLGDEEEDDAPMTPQELIDDMPIEDFSELIMIGLTNDGNLQIGDTLESLPEMLCVLETIKMQILLGQVQEAED